MNHLTFIRTLHENAIAAAQAEKAATFYLLECLHQIEKTRAHIELSYPTLFDYVHRGLSYSESQSYERITAMRLAFRVPDVAEKLKAGYLSLTTVARLGAHAKREKLRGEAIISLADRVAGRSVREVERILASEAKLPVLPRESLRPTSATTSALTITIDAEFETLLKEARELEADPTLTIAEVLKRALRARVMAKKKNKGWVGRLQEATGVMCKDGQVALARVGKDSNPLRTSGAGATASPEPVTQMNPRMKVHQDQKQVRRKRRPYIPMKTRQTLWSESQGQCSWVSPVTGLRCTSRQSLQIDHAKTPFALGGSNSADNLQHLCAVHNRQKGIETTKSN